MDLSMVLWLYSGNSSQSYHMDKEKPYDTSGRNIILTFAGIATRAPHLSRKAMSAPKYR